MSYTTVGIIDYGIGNHASVKHSLRELGYRVRISSEPASLDNTDLLLLPGVGAYPTAMMALHKHNLVQYLQSAALQGRPIMGLCLGMQLLASSSTEHGLTSGLDLIPGQVLPMQTPRWHIGWNLITCQTSDPLFQQSEGETFYFNHSYYFQGPSEYQVCISASPDPFASIIRRGQVVGMQFHPEKSQAAGRKLLKTVIDGLVHA